MSIWHKKTNKAVTIVGQDAGLVRYLENGVEKADPIMEFAASNGISEILEEISKTAFLQHCIKCGDAIIGIPYNVEVAGFICDTCDNIMKKAKNKENAIV